MSTDWVQLKDEDLLKLRICDLKLSLSGSELEGRVTALYQELESKGLNFRPKAYLGDEWFSPEGVCAIAIPFYLAHPRLVALEKRLMLEVEGDDPEYFQKLLRHEAGHCFDHAYRLSRRKRWEEVFGSPQKEYAPETYRPRPYSRSFVHNLGNWYAQAHPDEDFAETFATWLDPKSNWPAHYRDWPLAIKKIKYVEALAKEVGKKSPNKQSLDYRSLPCNAARLTTTLEKYYAKRKREHAPDYPDFYDGDLRRIFDGEGSLSKRDFSAARFMRRHKSEIIESVSYWTGEKKYTIQSLVKKLTTRCEELDLRLGKPEAQTNLEVAAYLATLVTNYLFTGKFKRTV